MKKCPKSGWSYILGAETTIEDGCIHFRPEIVITGDFHKGVGRLVLDVLIDRIKSICSDLSDYLRCPNDASIEKEVINDEKS